jgi:hypothetical protein
MDAKLIQNIRKNMEMKSTEELHGIWQANDKDQYAEEAFHVVDLLLKERGETPSSYKIEKLNAIEDEEGYTNYIGSKIEELSNEELITIIENHWNYPESFLEDIDKELNRRKLNIKDSKVNESTIPQDKTSPQQSNNEGFAGFLDFLGYITIIIGVIATVMLFINYSQPSLFSNGNISGTQMMIAFGVGFYHLVFGTLCLGVAKTLRQ